MARRTAASTAVWAIPRPTWSDQIWRDTDRNLRRNVCRSSIADIGLLHYRSTSSFTEGRYRETAEQFRKPKVSGSRNVEQDPLTRGAATSPPHGGGEV